MNGVVVSVGVDAGDIRGADDRALQAAVDLVAGRGGGVVRVLPGLYRMRNSLHLRSHVHVLGDGPETVLQKQAAASSRLYLDGDYGEEAVTLHDASGFEPGMGITVLDDRNSGFHTTVANIIGREGSTLTIDRPLNGDYMVAANAVAQTVFPVVSGYHVTGAVVEGLSIDGNRGANPHLNGCRGAGIFLYRGQGCRIVDCVVSHFNGDGISFQQSQETLVQGCECGGNASLGLHPGSGSQHATIRDCWSHDNGEIGLFLCWRVRFSLFEGNRLESNGRVGISIGHKDSDNRFLRNTSVGNGLYGLYFRDESEPMAGHRNVFEDCVFSGNGSAIEGAGVRIEGETHDITLRRCRIEGTTGRPQRVGLSIGPRSERIVLDDVSFAGNAIGEVEDERSPGGG